LGWSVGRNIQIDYRWNAEDPERGRRYASELVALAPDVLLSVSAVALLALREATRTVPIVFTGITDPVGAGFVASLARPGGNITGFALSEYGLAAKWLELLKQIAPRVTRVAVIRDSVTSVGVGQFASIQAVAPSLRTELSPLVVGDAAEIERAVTAFALGPNGGLVVTTGTLLQTNRELIITLAARHRLPTVYPFRRYVTDGGLLSYAADVIELMRPAAAYVDRILKGEKPADLPVQAPTKYSLVLNLKTAKALGLTIPETLLATADEVIQ
jgi:putative ABC transport system substrate-binding protein